MIYHGSYDSVNGRNTLDDLAGMVSSTISVLLPRADEYDSIAVMGVSGLLVGPPVALGVDKPLVVVRKGELCHFGLVVNGTRVGRRFIFLDDFIGTGKTKARVEEEIRNVNPEARCVATFSYDQMFWQTNDYGWTMFDAIPMPAVPAE